MDAYHICQKSKLWQKLSAARRFAHPSSSYMDGSIKVIGSGYLCKRDTAQCDPSNLKGEKITNHSIITTKTATLHTD